jgi:hypothetical protein
MWNTRVDMSFNTTSTIPERGGFGGGGGMFLGGGGLSGATEYVTHCVFAALTHVPAPLPGMIQPSCGGASTEKILHFVMSGKITLKAPEPPSGPIVAWVGLRVTPLQSTGPGGGGGGGGVTACILRLVVLSPPQ